MRLNETRNVLWHESCKCVCKLNSSVCNNKQIWNDDTCRWDCNEDFTDIISCDKGYTWNPSTCECLFPNDDQKNKYHQVWKEIFKIVDNENGELNLHEKIVLSDIDIYTDEIIKISSVTIVIKSLIEKDNKFYLELALNHCLYEI